MTEAVLVIGDDVASTLRTARDLHAAVECEPDFPAVRAGVHAGRVLEHDGKYFGAVLNLTARVAAYAAASQILCTDIVARQAEGLEDIQCREVGVCRMHVTPGTAPARLAFGETTYYFCSIGCARAFAERPHLYTGEAGGR